MQIPFTSESLPKAIKALFAQNNYEVTGPERIHGAEIDLVARSQSDPFSSPICIEVTIEYVDNEKYGKDLTKLSMVQKIDPQARCLIVSSSGFSLPVKERARATGIETLTYEELFTKFERFEPYLRSVVGTEKNAQFLRELNSIYEEPELQDRFGKHRATEFLTIWRDSTTNDKRWLILVGEYGTGKTALTQVLQYRWLLEYQSNPTQPIPFRLELRDFTRQFDARGLIHHFLDNNGLGHLPIEFVMSLIHSGRVILLLDGYDEMAQYLHARERRVCLEALADLSSGGARGMLTSRPNYFSEAEEFQVFEILYSAIAQRSIFLTESDRCYIEQERQVDELLESHFLNRYERVLKDLSPEQTESLVIRRLQDDPDGSKVVLGILRRVFRTMDEGPQIALSGKPVIIAYLLQVVDELKAKAETTTDKLSEWQLYKLVIDHLMIRDYRRSQYVMPDKRREFLQVLSHLLSKRDNAYIKEKQFCDLIKKFFSNELKRHLPEDRDRAVENYFADLRSSSTLTRADSHGPETGWRFSHNSLREFLITEYLLENIKSTSIDLQIPITDPMRIFVASRPDNEVRRLFRELVERWPQRHKQYGLGELLTLLWNGIIRLYSKEEDPVRASLVALSGETVALDGVYLKRIVFSTETRPTVLSNSTFRGTGLSSIEFSAANCQNVDFSEAVLENVIFRAADLTKATFRGSLLIDINVSGADLRECDFRDIDLESSILTESITNPEGISRFSGMRAIGYLKYHGATTDSIPSKHVYSHSPKFSIIEKICSVMASQSIHQRLGLEKRGTSQMDPRLATQFIGYLVKHGLAQTKKNRPGMVWTTAPGRQIFSQFCEEEKIPPVIEDFIKEKLLAAK
jgi:hypothetical protein